VLNAGVAQLVERHVANVNVAGSIPVSRLFKKQFFSFSSRPSAERKKKKKLRKESK
jgi:hypothetical protein